MIGYLGEKVFLGGCPDAWIKEASPQQGGDFAFDLTMWLAQLGSIAGRFSVQIKAGAHAKVHGDNDPYISVALTPQVCNIFLQDGNPVLLVFVSLKSSESSDDAEVYYLWAKPAIKSRLGSRTEFDEASPESMSFRIPLSNKLTKKLDISGYLKDYWTFNRVTSRLQGAEHAAEALQTVSGLTPRGMIGLTKANPDALSRWFSNESIQGTNLWPTPKPGTIVAKIKQLSEYITFGDSNQADSLIAELKHLTPNESDLLAELCYQEGRRALLDGDVNFALSKFSEAAHLQPTVAKYYAAELDSAVAAAVNAGETRRVPQSLLSKADQFVSDSDVGFQLVRVCALHGDFQKCEKLIADLDEPAKTKSHALYMAIRDDWQGVLQATNTGLLTNWDARTKAFLRILRLRGLLNAVTSGEETLVIGGRPSMAVSDALALRDATMEALREAQASGWSANAEMILDCASAVSLTCGPNSELLRLLSDFAQRRPRIRGAQEALARVATCMGEPEIAISALLRVKDLDAVNVARLVLLYGESGEHSKAVDVALKHLIDKPHETIIDVAVATAAVSAYRLGAAAEEAALKAFVDTGGTAAQSLLRFIVESMKNPAERDLHYDRLWEDAMVGGGDPTLQDNLLEYLKPSVEADVDRLLQLCEATRERRNLNEAESAKYAACLLRRERYQELIEFTEGAQKMFPQDENIGLCRAVALERIGQPSAAEQVLRRFDRSVRSDLINARAQLLLRVGDVDALVPLAQNALAGATSHADRFYYRRMLATLHSRGNPEQYLESAWQLGEMVDKDEEGEEGAFLLHFMMATSGDVPAVADLRVKEFQLRLNRFTERYPASTIIRAGHLQDDASPHALISELHRMAGVTEERANARRKAREIGKRSGSHIPMAFRPGSYAPCAASITELLAVTTNGLLHDEPTKLIIADEAFPVSPFSRPPILDLTTLLVLVELDLFVKLFSIWTAVAIPKESLAHLSELLFGSRMGGGSGLAGRVFDAVRSNRSRIVQPGSNEQSIPPFPKGELTTIRDEVLSGRYEYLSADMSAIAILNREAGATGHCRTLWDLLSACVESGSVSSSELTLTRLRVASWNTHGTPLESDDIVAAALGVAYQKDGGDAPASRAALKFLVGHEQKVLLARVSKVLIDLARGGAASWRDAATWFANLFYKEAALAQSFGINATTDELTAFLAVSTVAGIHEEPDADSLMASLWQILENERMNFSGSEDQRIFLALLGKHAARAFDRVSRRYGLSALQVEGKITDLLFSLTSAGTQDRAALEQAYFAETKELQTSRS